MISAMGLRRRGLWERIGEFFSSFSCGTQSRKTATRPQRSSGSLYELLISHQDQESDTGYGRVCFEGKRFFDSGLFVAVFSSPSTAL